MARWCRNLILTVPSGRLDENARRMGHLRHYREADLRGLAERAGMEVAYCRAWGFPFAYPIYARIRNRAGHEAVTGRYGWGRRLTAGALFGLFHLNDLFSGGNKIIMLARARKHEGG